MVLCILQFRIEHGQDCSKVDFYSLTIDVGDEAQIQPAELFLPCLEHDDGGFSLLSIEQYAI